MIIQGFEIENWTCIKRLAVANLPATGVVVLHARNRTGKSSLVRALRACLMDYPSTSTASPLKSAYPRGTGEKPCVTVTFKARGTVYRIKKYFGTNKSELASETSTGAWRVETTVAAEAHARVCDYAGGDDSSKGLNQLLWLTQTEFRLPKPREFDDSTQAQLRGVLGVLQTPLDDRFINHLKKRWNVWHSGERKSGKQPAIKEACSLARNQSRLDEAREALRAKDLKFDEVEELVRQTSELEAQKVHLNRQLDEQRDELRAHQEVRERSQGRIATRKLAEERHARAYKEWQDSLIEQGQRADAVARLHDIETSLEPAARKVKNAEQVVESMETRLKKGKRDLSEHRERRHVLWRRINRISANLRSIDDANKLDIAQTELRHASEIAEDIASLKRYFTENPVADPKQLDALKANRLRVLELQANRDAASMTVRIVPIDGAAQAQLAKDGSPFLSAVPQSSSTHSVQRKAELLIPSWGRVELTRGTSDSDFDEIDGDLRQCDEEFANAVSSLGIAPTDPDAFDQVLRRDAEQGVKKDELQKREREFRKLAPKGIEPLQRKVLELGTKLRGAAAADTDETERLPNEATELEALRADLERDIERLDQEITTLTCDLEEVETQLSERRAAVTDAKQTLAGLEATAKVRREELDRLRAEDRIIQRVGDAISDLGVAETQLKQSELTVEELTIEERLAVCKEAVNALEQQIRDNDEKYHRIKGRLEGSEGLHAERASLAARVDELSRVTASESLEREAVDRLYELFEECREKQLGTLMGPIHDRVLNWMRVLDIDDYKEMRFGDTFLPDKLVRRDGTAEFAIEEESTGAQEQIGILVRLALGSLLTSHEEPAVAILDDPLTHCDVGRLNKLRVILRRAAEGDSKLSPPAGPLQIIILTCHPERFRDERATVIDLESAIVTAV